jgi:hypothetical protein
LQTHPLSSCSSCWTRTASAAAGFRLQSVPEERHRAAAGVALERRTSIDLQQSAL